MPNNRAEEKVDNKNQKVMANVSEKPVFSWEAPEFAFYSKNSTWYLIIILAAVVLIVFFAWQKNWTAVGVSAAAGIALFAQAQIKPKSLKCALYRSGVVINDRVYTYDEMKSFWIVFSDHPFIRFERARRLSSNVNLPIAEEDPEQIRLFLAKYLPQDEEKGEDLADTIQRWFRF